MVPALAPLLFAVLAVAALAPGIMVAPGESWLDDGVLTVRG
jgi:hypothetical protein